MGALGNQSMQGAQQFGNQMFNNPLVGGANQLAQQFQGQMGSDPLALQQQLFNQQAGLLQPGFDQASRGLEDRLFSQGRLGSTGGALQQEGLQNSQQQALGQLLGQSFGQSQAQQAQTAGLANQFGMFGGQLQGQLGQLQGQQLGNALNINQGAMAGLGLGGQLSGFSGSQSSGLGGSQSFGQSTSSGQSTSTGTGAQDPSFNNTLGNELFGGGVNALVNMIGGTSNAGAIPGNQLFPSTDGLFINNPIGQ